MRRRICSRATRTTAGSIFDAENVEEILGGGEFAQIVETRSWPVLLFDWSLDEELAHPRLQMREPRLEKVDAIDEHRNGVADRIGNEMMFEIDATVGTRCVGARPARCGRECRRPSFPAATSSMTTEFAPMRARAPTVIGPRILAPAPISTPFSIVG